MENPQNIPLTEIDATALPRDRTLIHAAAQDELTASIAQNGLRLPIEVYRTETGFALISGYRRLLAFQTLSQQNPELHAGKTFTQIPAFIRTPADRTAALAAMIEENEIRAALSPWERARIAITTQDAGLFDTIDAALKCLYPHISRQKRAKLRAVAEVVEALGAQLKDPEILTENQLLRLSNALKLDWREIIIATLDEIRCATHTTQWQTLLPVLTELETLVQSKKSTNPNRPRRLSRPIRGLNIRREKTKNGYTLHLTGSRADGALVTSVLEDIELLLSEG